LLRCNSKTASIRIRIDVKSMIGVMHRVAVLQHFLPCCVVQLRSL